MSDFKPGEVVDITIKGARIVEHVGTSLAFEYLSDPRDAAGRVIYSRGNVRADAHSITVERVAPAEWPPQAGDVWRDRHGSPWFAVDIHDIDETDVPEIVMVLAYEGARRPPEEFNQIGGPVVLVHREPVDAEIVDEQDGDA